MHINSEMKDFYVIVHHKEELVKKGTLFGAPLALRPGRFELLTLRSAI